MNCKKSAMSEYNRCYEWVKSIQVPPFANVVTNQNPNSVTVSKLSHRQHYPAVHNQTSINNPLSLAESPNPVPNNEFILIGPGQHEKLPTNLKMYPIRSMCQDNTDSKTNLKEYEEAKEKAREFLARAKLNETDNSNRGDMKNLIDFYDNNDLKDSPEAFGDQEELADKTSNEPQSLRSVANDKSRCVTDLFDLSKNVKSKIVSNSKRPPKKAWTKPTKSRNEEDNAIYIVPNNITSNRKFKSQQSKPQVLHRMCEPSDKSRTKQSSIKMHSNSESLTDASNRVRSEVILLNEKLVSHSGKSTRDNLECRSSNLSEHNYVDSSTCVYPVVVCNDISDNSDSFSKRFSHNVKDNPPREPSVSLSECQDMYHTKEAYNSANHNKPIRFNMKNVNTKFNRNGHSTTTDSFSSHVPSNQEPCSIYVDGSENVKNCRPASGMLTTYKESFDPKYIKPKKHNEAYVPTEVDEEWLQEVNRLRDLAEKFKIRSLSSSIWWDKDIDSPVNLYSEVSAKEHATHQSTNISSNSIPISYELQPTSQPPEVVPIRAPIRPQKSNNTQTKSSKTQTVFNSTNNGRVDKFDSITNDQPKVPGTTYYNPQTYANDVPIRQTNDLPHRRYARGEQETGLKKDPSCHTASNNCDCDCLVSASPDYFVIPEDVRPFNENNNYPHQLSNESSYYHGIPFRKRMDTKSIGNNTNMQSSKNYKTIDSTINPTYKTSRRRLPLNAIQTHHNNQTQSNKPPSLVFKKENLKRLLKGRDSFSHYS